MGLKVSISPEPLTATQKRSMKSWLQGMLDHPELASGVEIPIQNFGLYVNGQWKQIQFGVWMATDLQPVHQTGEYRLRVGMMNSRYHAPTKPERVAVLGGIVGVFGLWDDLATTYSRAVGRTILEAYNSCFLGMINAPQPAVKLAFSANRSQAAVQYQGDDKWYLNNGEPIAVDDSWHQVSA